MFHDECKIVVNKQVSAEFWELSLNFLENVSKVKPGQFVQLKLIKEDGYLFRKPFSISNVCLTKNTISILYKIIGKTTREMTNLQINQSLDVIAPLGNGFQIGKTKTHILVGGGVGIAPLYLLAKKIKEVSSDTVIVFLGYRHKSQIVYESEFSAVSDKLVIATDDGSYGEKGFVTNAVKDYFSTINEKVTIYSCGPKPMMKILQDMAVQNEEISCQLSLEEYMACGIGACLGCVVNIKDGNTIKYKRVCKDGPVFDAREVVFA